MAGYQLCAHVLNCNKKWQIKHTKHFFLFSYKQKFIVLISTVISGSDKVYRLGWSFLIKNLLGSIKINNAPCCYDAFSVKIKNYRDYILVYRHTFGGL